MTVAGNDYFLPFEKLIRSIIYKNLIVTGFYDRTENEDLFQEIATDLLVRQEKILGSYKGLAQFSTYLYMVVIRKCSELKRRKIADGDKGKLFGHFDQQELAIWFGNIPHNDLNAEQKIMINENCQKLADIIDTYHSKKHKLVFSLKSLFRLLVNIFYLIEYKPSEEDKMKISSCIMRLNESSTLLTDQEIYALLTIIFNSLEKKKNKNDAIRKWIEEKMDQIVVLLNRPPSTANFDRETLAILFEKCYTKSN